MGTRTIIAICKDCEDTERGFPSEYGEFSIVMEWFSKEELIKHIKETHCPTCNSNNWFLTDASEI